MRALPLPRPERCDTPDCRAAASWFVEFRTMDGKDVAVRVCTACAKRMGAKIPEGTR